MYIINNNNNNDNDYHNNKHNGYRNGFVTASARAYKMLGPRIPQRRLPTQEETSRKQGDTIYIIAFGVYYRPVFSEAPLGFGVSSGKFRDWAVMRLVVRGSIGHKHNHVAPETSTGTTGDTCKSSSVKQHDALMMYVAIFDFTYLLKSVIEYDTRAFRNLMCVCMYMYTGVCTPIRMRMSK